MIFWSIVFLGDCTGTGAYYNCCTSDYKCTEYEGFCSNDGDCEGDLRCGRNENCPNSYNYCCYNYTAGMQI